MKRSAVQHYELIRGRAVHSGGRLILRGAVVAPVDERERDFFDTLTGHFLDANGARVERYYFRLTDAPLRDAPPAKPVAKKRRASLPEQRLARRRGRTPAQVFPNVTDDDDLGGAA